MRKTKIKTLVCVIIGFRALSCCDAQQDALSHVTNSPCSRNLVFDYIYRNCISIKKLLSRTSFRAYDILSNDSLLVLTASNGL